MLEIMKRKDGTLLALRVMRLVMDIDFGPNRPESLRYGGIMVGKDKRKHAAFIFWRFYWVDTPTWLQSLICYTRSEFFRWQAACRWAMKKREE